MYEGEAKTLYRRPYRSFRIPVRAPVVQAIPSGGQIPLAAPSAARLNARFGPRLERFALGPVEDPVVAAEVTS